ncbi:MAG: tRNA 5-methoxyuridine(34)/uridine 5-oxyacetic acid(34) synthase CmoB [Turneriella sp.]
MVFPLSDFFSDGLRAKLEDALAKPAELLQTQQLTGFNERIDKINFRCEQFSVIDGCITMTGHYAELEQAAEVRRLAEDLIPWRKGPFVLGDLLIDGEWRSDHKWNRLLPALPDLTGKTIADIGCNNGYYLYRIAAHQAARVVGFDPTLKYWLQYRLIAAHAPALPVDYLPLGWQALNAFREMFDVIFLMGVNYHEAEPTGALHACMHALKPGGLLVCESVVLPGEAQIEFFPPGRYAGIGGVFGIPTAAALAAQLILCGFHNVTIQHNVALTSAEQRATAFSPHKSFADYLTSEGTTIEGYPPPYRAALMAYK